MAPARLFSLTAILVILFFYLIPDSKRSVYLLPIYPFLSYFLAEYMRYLVQEHRKAWRVFGILFSTISGIFFLLFIGLKAGWFERWISAESVYRLFLWIRTGRRSEGHLSGCTGQPAGNLLWGSDCGSCVLRSDGTDYALSWRAYL